MIRSEVGERDCQVVGLMWMEKMDFVDDINKVKNPEDWVRKKHGTPHVRNVRVFVLEPLASSIITFEVESRIRENVKPPSSAEAVIAFLKALYGHLHGTGWPLPAVTMLKGGGAVVSWNEKGKDSAMPNQETTLVWNIWNDDKADISSNIIVTFSPDGSAKFSAESRVNNSEMSGHCPADNVVHVMAPFMLGHGGWYRP
jgi:hypothetical protein